MAQRVNIQAENHLPDPGLIDLAHFSPAEAIKWQKQWARRVRIEQIATPIKTVAAADMAITPDGRHCVAAVLVMRMPDMAILATAHARLQLQVPYIPGLLSFREAPAVIAAARRLSITPDVLLVDGQGLAHPRRFGLACHIGLALDWPTIGCAKSRLIGDYQEPGLNKGCRRRLTDKGEIIGAVLRSRRGVKCIYISVGHRAELEQAVKLVLQCCRRYRLPEPARHAHQLVTKLRFETQ